MESISYGVCDANQQVWQTLHITGLYHLNICYTNLHNIKGFPSQTRDPVPSVMAIRTNPLG